MLKFDVLHNLCSAHAQLETKHRHAIKRCVLIISCELQLEIKSTANKQLDNLLIINVVSIVHKKYFMTPCYLLYPFNIQHITLIDGTNSKSSKGQMRQGFIYLVGRNELFL